MSTLAQKLDQVLKECRPANGAPALHLLPQEQQYAVVADLDGALADASHRQYLLKGQRPDALAYYMEMANDFPVLPLITAYRCLQLSGYPGIICSGRPDTYRTATEEWLEQYSISCACLYMRRESDYRPDALVKHDLLKRMRREGFEPLIVMDSDLASVEMWRREGLVCLQSSSLRRPSYQSAR